MKNNVIAAVGGLIVGLLISGQTADVAPNPHVVSLQSVIGFSSSSGQSVYLYRAWSDGYCDIASVREITTNGEYFPENPRWSDWWPLEQR